MDPSMHPMDDLAMVLGTDMDLFHNNGHAFISSTDINNGFSFPSNDLAAVSWDLAASKLQTQRSINAISDATMDFVPDLSPAMSLCTPSIHTIKSEYTFDALGLDELGASPSVGWSSPLEDGFGSQQSQESFDYDFGLSQNAPIWSSQNDFQLFPDNAGSVSSLEQLLMTPAPMESGLSIIDESPFESDMDYISPLNSLTTSPILGDYPELFDGSSFAASPAAGGDVRYKLSKRPRRRRMTSEEEARVPADDGNEDPEAPCRYKCSVCDKTFSRPFNLRSHRATHAGVKPFTCTHVGDKGDACNWSFARRHDLERHMRSRHSPEKMFKCKTCGSECGRTDAFKRHLQRHPACGLAALKEQQEQQQQQNTVMMEHD
ncbi:hypothetical protein EDD11_001694 [Mortierella claussenii]|nr:hypothetical protein EDD11_001694 [Mortierella claussenii]